jgi:hypothetical protein
MNLKAAYYELRFENEFRSSKGDEFQRFFERVMGLVHRTDFMACRPWGNQGDRKNDGFLKSERRLFQVYAPNEIGAAKAVQKIREDFEGAKIHWGRYFDKWVFAHNAADGLPAHVHEAILELERANPGVKLETWGLEELRLVFRKVADDDRAAWLGPVPSDEMKIELGFADLQIVLEQLGDQPMVPHERVKDVPMGKIEANALSESVVVMLKAGMSKAPLVADFFNRWHDETFGERIAAAFRQEYQALRGHFRPEQIFGEMESWAGGARRGSPKHQLAVLAVLAYYFDSCDIFEEPRRPTV